MYDIRFIDAGGAYINKQGNLIVSEIHMKVDEQSSNDLLSMTDKELENFIRKEYFNNGIVNWLVIQ